jgi:hypothetical protein
MSYDVKCFIKISKYFHIQTSFEILKFLFLLILLHVRRKKLFLYKGHPESYKTLLNTYGGLVWRISDDISYINTTSIWNERV